MKNFKLLAALLVLCPGAVFAQEDKNFTLEELAAYAEANNAYPCVYLLNMAKLGTDTRDYINKARKNAKKIFHNSELYLNRAFPKEIKHLEKSVSKKCPNDIMTTSWAKTRKNLTEAQHGSAIFRDALEATLKDAQLKEVSLDCRNKLEYIIWAEQKRADSVHNYEVYRTIATQADKLIQKMDEPKTNS